MSVSAGSMPRVGLIMPLASQQGGAERLFQNLLHASRNMLDYKVLFLQDGPLVGEARALGYDTAVLGTTQLRDVRNYIAVVRALRSWMDALQLDLVFSWMLKGHLYAGPAALLARRKRMWFQHGLAKRHWMDIAGGLLPSDGILCCSSYVKATQDRLRSAQPTVVCHPGVVLPEAPLISKRDARSRLGITAQAEIICMVARLERWKGTDVFIEAARLVAERRPDAIFCAVGGPHPLDPEYAAEVYERGKSSGLGERLLLAGQRSSEEVRLWQASADIVVHPVTEPEPFGMAVVEAMGAGCAVIASRAGGIPEIIDDGVNGVFVEPGDVTGLAGAMDRLLRDTPMRQQIGSGAFARAQTFSAEAFATRFESLVLSVLAARESF